MDIVEIGVTPSSPTDTGDCFRIHRPARKLNKWVQTYAKKNKTKVVTPPSAPNHELASKHSGHYGTAIAWSQGGQV